MTSREELMRKLAEEVWSCRRCRLGSLRKNAVVGEGSLEAELFLVGEAPGRVEDETGRPFVGAAGRLLDRLLADIGLERGEVYIGNILKCRPPGNRRPRADEVEACTPYLERQLAIIQPRVIAPMGNSAAGYLLKRFGYEALSISRVHGRCFEAEAPWGRVLLFPLYHPAAALYAKELLRILEDDFRVLGGILRRLRGAP
ncbi:uracil-DNA glycosylase [Candidatus Bathyarchaeota archaeon]|nr:MAG: uracil-DNA glycosylase [Candidatus Bathyarchaeota archaeon]